MMNDTSLKAKIRNIAKQKKYLVKSCCKTIYLNVLCFAYL